ncbi:MAG: hypothetical protein ACOCYZ_02925 [Halococcoides sp.]
MLRSVGAVSGTFAAVGTTAGEETTTASGGEVLDVNVELLGTGGSDAENAATITVEGSQVVIDGVVVNEGEECADPTLDTSYDGTKLTVVGGKESSSEDCLARPDAVEYRATIELSSPPEVVHLDYAPVAFERFWRDLPPVDGAEPTDPDHDGLYEDLSGDGRLNFPDVNAFFQHADQSVVQDHVAAYDFTGDDRVDLQDVLALFEMV